MRATGLCERHDRHTVAAVACTAFMKLFDERVAGELGAYRRTEDTGSFAVDDAHKRHSRTRGIIDVAVDHRLGFLRALSAQVEFKANGGYG